IDQSREQDHRPAERPDHQQALVMVTEVETPAEPPNYRHLEEHQPKTATYQESREIVFRFAVTGGKERARSGEKEKHRRAEMRNPAREKQRRVRLGEIARLE